MILYISVPRSVVFELFMYFYNIIQKSIFLTADFVVDDVVLLLPSITRIVRTSCVSINIEHSIITQILGVIF